MDLGRTCEAQKLRPAAFAGFGMIIRVLFGALYAAFRVLLALVVTRGRGEAAKDVELVGAENAIHRLLSGL